MVIDPGASNFKTWIYTDSHGLYILSAVAQPCTSPTPLLSTSKSSMAAGLTTNLCVVIWKPVDLIEALEEAALKYIVPIRIMVRTGVTS